MQSQINTRILVTSAGAPPGTNVIRALKKIPGVEIIGADVDPCAAALYLYPDRAVSLPLVSDEGEYVEAPKALIRKESIAILVPGLEPEVLAVARHREALLSAGARFFGSGGGDFGKNHSGSGPPALSLKIHAQTKKPMLLEIKPRMWGYSRLAAECGVNFPRVMADYLLGRPVKERHEYSLDRVFMRGYRDVVMWNFRIAGAPK